MSELQKIANQFVFGSEMRPNPEVAQEIIDNGAFLNDFILTYQLAGGDIAQFPEEDWREVLSKTFNVTEDELADAMEQLAAWGVVDNRDPI